MGDLHIGYDYMIQKSGVLFPERQIDGMIIELDEIFKIIKEKKYILKKIIFLGDIKHSFGFEYREKNYLNKIFQFLKKHIEEKNIIFIKGNHDTFNYSPRDKLRNYYINDELAFTHGDKFFKSVFNKKIKTIVIGHIHPSIIISDKQNIRREKFKCFLKGKYKNKNIIILPSFLSSAEGMTINKFKEDYEDSFSIIPKKTLSNFEVYVIGKKDIFDFGKLKKLSTSSVASV